MFKMNTQDTSTEIQQMVEKCNYTFEHERMRCIHSFCSLNGKVVFYCALLILHRKSQCGEGLIRHHILLHSKLNQSIEHIIVCFNYIKQIHIVLSVCFSI